MATIVASIDTAAFDPAGAIAWSTSEPHPAAMTHCETLKRAFCMPARRPASATEMPTRQTSIASAPEHA